MEALTLYLWRSAVVVLLVYLFYRLFLRRETYFHYNRLFLVSGLVLSVVLPLLPSTLLPFSLSESRVGAFPVMLQAAVVTSVRTGAPVVADSTSIPSLLPLFYFAGVCLLGMSMVMGIVRLVRLYSRNPKVHEVGFVVVLLKKKITPFTFFRWLFVHRDDFHPQQRSAMLAHEIAHREQGHSFDLLLLELVTLIQWFNPFVWMVGKALRKEQEYLADGQVLRLGYNRIAYQQLLLEHCLGIDSIPLTTHYNRSLLLYRMKKMATPKSKPWVKIKYLISALFTLITAGLLALNPLSPTPAMVDTGHKLFSENRSALSQGVDSSVAHPDSQRFVAIDTPALYNGGELSGVKTFINQNLKYPAIAIEKGLQGRVYVAYSIDEKGILVEPSVKQSRLTVIDATNRATEISTESGKVPEALKDAVAALEQEALRVVGLLDGFTPAKMEGKAVKVSYLLPIQFVLSEPGADKEKIAPPPPPPPTRSTGSSSTTPVVIKLPPPPPPPVRR
ncbi:MAG: M56 family metallopeptidase [Bacteroidales bacterium]